MADTKYCKFCGEQIDIDAVICPKCGKQVEEIKVSQPQQQATPNIVINNANSNVNRNTNINGYGPKPKNKWTALFLCLFLGMFGAHKFYEGKVLLGIVYLCTLGLVGIGWFIDLIALLFKPNPYYV